MQEGCQTAEFRFYEELNDVLPAERRKQSFAYAFRGAPAIKDAIEAIGVPHTEVDLILVNGVSVGFDYRLQAGDRVSVYPVFESLDIGSVPRLRPQPLREPKFVCDVHLGKLARRLRLLGFDVAYRNTATDPEVVETALAEQRSILTQDRGILKLKKVTHGYLVRSPHVHEQVVEVLRRFDLTARIDPFSRCTQCNGLIRAVDKAEVEGDLPPKTREYYHEFFRCEACGKVYWKGTHFSRMEAEVQELLSRGSGPQDRPVITGVGMSGLDHPGLVQLSLFPEAEHERQSRLDEVADRIKEKFGGCSRRCGGWCKKTAGRVSNECLQGR